MGLIASILGLLLGIATAQGINALFKAFGAELPQEGLVLKPRTVIVALLVGTGVTMLSSLAPARRATRVPPLAAMREEAATPQPPTRRRKVLSWALLFIGAAALSDRALRRRPGRSGPRPAGDRRDPRLHRGGAAEPAARAADRRRGGISPGAAAWRGRSACARERAPQPEPHGRHGRGTDDRACAGDVRGHPRGRSEGIDRRHDQQGHEGSDRGDEQGRVLSDQPPDRRRPEASPRRGDRLAAEHVPGQGRTGSAASRSGAGSTRPRSTRSGTCRSTRGRPTCCRRSVPARHRAGEGLCRGQQLRSRRHVEGDNPGRRKAELRVRGDVRGQGRTDRRLRRHRTTSSGGTSACGTTFWSSSPYSRAQTRRRSRSRIDSVLEQRFPITEAQSRKEFQDSITGNIDQFLFLIYALLSLSVIVSLFGIVNTLVLSIHERTREIGMMRAIGTPRSLVRRIVRYESVITALIGAALGLAVGFFLGVVTTIALEDEGFILSIPYITPDRVRGAGGPCGCAGGDPAGAARIAAERAGSAGVRIEASAGLPSLRPDASADFVRRGRRAGRADGPRGHRAPGGRRLERAPGRLRRVDGHVLAGEREERRVRGGLRFLRAVEVRRRRDPDARPDGARADSRACARGRGGRRPPLLHGHPGPGPLETRLRQGPRGHAAGG